MVNDLMEKCFGDDIPENCRVNLHHKCGGKTALALATEHSEAIFFKVAALTPDVFEHTLPYSPLDYAIENKKFDFALRMLEGCHQVMPSSRKQLLRLLLENVVIAKIGVNKNLV